MSSTKHESSSPTRMQDQSVKHLIQWGDHLSVRLFYLDLSKLNNYLLLQRKSHINNCIASKNHLSCRRSNHQGKYIMEERCDLPCKSCIRFEHHK